MADADAPEAYWLVEQAIAWALTRDLEFVEQIAGSADPGSLALSAEIGLRQVKLKARGRDINLELWDANLWSISPAETGMRVSASGWPQAFPIRQHFENLLRAGRLRSVGTRPGETESRALSPADWNNLELTHVVLTEHGSARDLLRQQQLLANGSLPPRRQGLSEGRSLEFPGLNPPSVLVARPRARRGVPQSSPDPFLIQISKADALREFPAEPPVEVAAAGAAAGAPIAADEPPAQPDETAGSPNETAGSSVDATSSAEAQPAAEEEATAGPAASRRPTDEEVRARLRLLQQERGAVPSQAACWEIVGDLYPQLTRDALVALHHVEWPDAKSGPRGPRKNRPK
jgi:hypothetical protein